MPDANRENRADTCWVYFIQAGPHGAIKIGSSVDPWKRVRELQVGHPEVLQMRGAMLGGFAMERKLHRLFRSDRLRGEWFRPSSALLAFVDAQVPEPSTRPSKERPEPPLRAFLTSDPNQDLRPVPRWRLSDGRAHPVEVRFEDPKLMRLRAAVEASRRTA